jgi:pectate disaccharide-lyase
MNVFADRPRVSTVARRASRLGSLGLTALMLAGSGVLPGCGQGGDGGGSGGAPGAGGGGSPTGTGGSSSGTGGSTAGDTGGSPGGTAGVTGAAGGAAGGRTGAGGSTVTGVGGSTGTGGASAPTNAYWIGPTGSDINPGTQAAPFATLIHANLFAQPGLTIWVLPGTYHFSNVTNLGQTGTAANPINVFAAPGARPVLDFAGEPRNVDGNRGINISGSYWHVRGIEVKNAADNCVAIAGSHNIVEDVITDFCGDTGLQITVPGALAGDATLGAFNTILNCDSHDNYDAATNGENADGFAAKLDIGNGNVFRGCRSWNNSDDGYDLFGVPEPVTIDNCWAMLNGHISSGTKGPAADGNGFKLGGNNVPGIHVVTNSFSMTNDTCGFTLNNNAAQPRVTGCGVNGNKSTFCDGLTHSGDVTITMTGAQAIAAVRVTNAAAGASTLPAIH